MYRVILVDDEDIIVEGLKKVIDWEKYGCEVAATASDAAEGARLIRELRPDILFTDIKMPNLDGLAMLAGLKGEFPSMQITVLTGYRDFEYAKRAINLGVTRFLLKPSKMRELDEALQAMTGNLKRLAAAVPAEPEPPRKEPVPAEPGEGGTQPETANGFIVRTALRYIEGHYTEKLTLTELADHAHVSQWYLSKLLNKFTGKSFSDLINQQRVSKAEQLLQDPSLKIHQIAEMLGFNDVTHFSKTFKKLRDVSPNEYRNRECG